MALFGKQDDRQVRPEVTPAPTPTVASAAGRTSEPAAADIQAHLARGSRVEGKLHFDGSVRIDGKVEGEIEAKDTVLIGESAVVVAQITAGTVIAIGKITGDINARKRAELRAPCRLLGNIVTPSLVIQEGVVFEGHCSMAGADAPEKPERDGGKVAVFPKDDRSSAFVATEAAK